MENELLEEKIKMLTKELGFLKDLFLAHAGKVEATMMSLNVLTRFTANLNKYRYLYCDIVLYIYLFL